MTASDNEWFATTRWSVVNAAAGHHDSEQRRLALGELCQSYWYPLYAYLRRRQCSAEEAEDVVQGLFLELLRRDDLRRVAPEKGRFRAFLLAAVKHHFSNQLKRDRAQKRGGGRALVELDAASAEQRYSAEPADNETPETTYHRAWAVTLLQRAREELAEQYTAAGKSDRFAALERFLTPSAEDEASHQDAAERLGLTVGSVKVAVHRLRRQYGQLLRREIAQTVDSLQDVDEELTELLNAFSA